MSTETEDRTRLVEKFTCDHGTFNIRAWPVVNKDELALRAKRWGHLPIAEAFGDDFALNDLVTQAWYPKHICSCGVEYMASRHREGPLLGTKIMSMCDAHSNITDPTKLMRELQAICIEMQADQEE